jgi:hypothetical protein
MWNQAHQSLQQLQRVVFIHLGLAALYDTRPRQKSAVQSVTAGGFLEI